MIMVAKDDVLKGLKKFKRLAKQDLLVSQLTPDPQFWTEQAEGRRDTYAKLMNIIDDHGLDHAYRYALQKYADLPFLFENGQQNPTTIGNRQALEMFFTIIGVNPNKQKHTKTTLTNPVKDTGDIVLNAQS